MKACILLVLFTLGFGQQFDGILINSDKRIKPLQTFYNEAITTIYGKSYTKIDGVKRSSMETVRFLHEDSKNVKIESMFVVDHREFKTQVSLLPTKKYFNYLELTENESLNALIRVAIDKSREKIPVNVVEDAALQVNRQLGAFNKIMSMYEYAVVIEGENWKTLYDAHETHMKFSYNDGYSILMAEVLEHQKSVISPELADKRDYELSYNKVQPFLYTWILLLISTILMGIYQIKPSNLLKNIAKINFAASFLLLAYGFTLRVLISGRAPVTNMYESVIWVGFAATTLAIMKFLKGKKEDMKLIPYALGAATLAIMAADLLPNVFDAGISPLQPVLRSNFWLTTHVLIITFSYGAFAVSFVLSVVAVLRYLIKNEKFSIHTERANYSAVKVGTLSLALGTLLGAVWADFAWGRFWGWDPKETWAAITLIVYMVILHGRFAGWVKKELNYVYSIFGFLSVLMAWYGVNYILGVGLHSYGFSKAGNSWFFYLAGIMTFLCLLAIRKFNSNNKPVKASSLREA